MLMRLLALVLCTLSCSGQEVRVPLLIRPVSLDPGLVTDLRVHRVAAQIFEAPLRARATDRGRVEVGPGLCVLEGTDEGGRLLRLRVREGARFHDHDLFEGGRGRLVTAEDIAFMLRRQADPQWASPWWGPCLAGLVVGLDEWRASAAEQGFADHEAPIAGLMAEGQLLRVRLTRASGEFVTSLSQSWAAVVPPEAIGRYGTGFGERHPIGTGPFALEAIEERAFVLRRNEAHPDVRGEGVPSRLRFVVLEDEAKALDLFRHGGLDICDLGPSAVHRALDTRGRLRADLRRVASLARGPHVEVGYLAFGLTHGSLKERWLREAISKAVDRKAVAASLFGPCAEASTAPVPAGLAPAGVGAAARRAARRDIKAARRLLAENGHPRGEGLPTLIMDVPGASEDERAMSAARALVGQLAEVGLAVQLRTEAWDQFWSRAQAGQIQIVWLRWFLDYPDALNVLRLFHSKEQQNHGRYRSEAFDTLFDRVAEMPPGAARERGVRDLSRMVDADLPWASLYHLRGLALVRRGLAGYRPSHLTPGLEGLRWTKRRR